MFAIGLLGTSVALDTSSCFRPVRSCSIADDVAFLRVSCAQSFVQPRLVARPRHFVLCGEHRERRKRGESAGVSEDSSVRFAVAAAGVAVAAASIAAATFEERYVAQQTRAHGCDVAGRPPYLGCTESADVRTSVCRSLLRTWPGGDVHEFWSVVGGLSGLDSLNAFATSQIQVGRIVFFDRDPVQLLFGELVMALVTLCPTREEFVFSLFGRSMEAWGRSLGVSSMLDFLDFPIDDTVREDIVARLPEHLRDLYGIVFACLAHREGWPLVWPCFGQKEKLPVRQLSNAKRRLGGGRNETLHINETGWLRDERSYGLVRAAVMLQAPEFRLLDLESVCHFWREDRCDSKKRRLLFISNIEGSPQFMEGSALENLRTSILAAATSAEAGTLLLSTQRAEWLSAPVASAD